MYTILENARIVLALLKKHNIRHIVLSPGGSNIPIVQGVQQDPFFKCYSVVDERSAMYFAIGLYLQTGEVVATSCTSAQATRNYVPGLTEAFYKHVPILAITMSKHPMYLGQDYMQCPIQTSLPVDAVKHSYSLPCINTDNDRYQCIRIANEAILELTHNGNGPVQLNIEELDSQTWLFDKSINALEDVRAIKRYYTNNISENELANKRILLLIGEHRPFSIKEVQAIESFSNQYNAIVYTNHISNIDCKYSIKGKIVSAMASEKLFNEQLCPDILLTIGGLTGDYDIYNRLFKADNGRFEHWRIDIDGKVVDTYNKLTRIYQMSIEDFFGSFLQSKNIEVHSYYDAWKSLYDKIDFDVDVPLSHLFVALQLYKKIPENSVMHFAILSSLNTWSYMPLDRTITAYSNVAAFGIDGCLSTLVGQSVLTENFCFHITGDLSFFYDMNALGIRHIKKNLKILLVNNNGGMTFKFGNLQDQIDVSSYIAADNHFKNAKGWAETNGFKYISVYNKEELSMNIDTFVSDSSMPILMEVFTNPEDENKAYAIFNRANKLRTDSEEKRYRIIDGIKDIIGEDGISELKKIKNRISI